MTVAWHITPTENVDAILTEGLVPQLGPRSRALGEPIAAIFLFPTLADAEDALGNWLGDQFDEDEPLALLRVQVPASAKHLPSGAAYELPVATAIPSTAVQVLHRDIGSLAGLDEAAICANGGPLDADAEADMPSP